MSKAELQRWLIQVHTEPISGALTMGLLWHVELPWATKINAFAVKASGFRLELICCAFMASGARTPRFGTCTPLQV